MVNIFDTTGFDVHFISRQAYKHGHWLVARYVDGMTGVVKVLG